MYFATLTAGPDGAMWFTEPSANKIGRIGIAGEHDFAVRSGPAVEPLGLGVAPTIAAQDGRGSITLRRDDAPCRLIYSSQ
jgi:hypothetical protein